MRYTLIVLATLFFPMLAAAQSVAPRDGWVVIDTGKDHATLLKDLVTAVAANGMGVVTQAGPTGAAKSRGITIPENRVIGVFNNEFAVNILALSAAAMIEAPIRFYVTENTDGTATLSYKTPGFVFAPYLNEGGKRLAGLAAQLDAIFETIATSATR